MQNTTLLDANLIEEDNEEKKLRPASLDDFVGQNHIKANLKVFIEAAKSRKSNLDHVILYGPPGLGKTTIAQIIAKEMGGNIRTTAGPIIAKSGDLASIITNLEEGDVLFIDEIHRLNPAIEEILYPAMEDFKLDLIIGEGPAARSICIDLPKFTLVGATTRMGLISNPLRDRFGIPLRLDFYESADLAQIILRGAGIFNVEISEAGALEIAKRSRGTPRIALRLLRRACDFALVQKAKILDENIAKSALSRLDVDALGLDSNDIRYLRFIAENYDGGPVGIETIAAALSEQKDSIEETIEPYLIQMGFINRTTRGRILTKQALDHLTRV